MRADVRRMARLVQADRKVPQIAVVSRKASESKYISRTLRWTSGSTTFRQK